MKTFGIAFFFVHSAEYSGDPSYPFPAPLVPSSLLLNRNPWADEPVCLILHLWKNIWADSAFFGHYK